MPLPQPLVRDIGGRIGVYLPTRPTAAPTVTLRNQLGSTQGTVEALNSTLGTANTTTTGAVTRGSLAAVAVASATGIVSGQAYELGPANPSTATEPTETVRVRSVSGLNVTLARPPLYDHASGVAFFSSLATYDVLAADASAYFLHGHMEFAWTDLDTLAQRTVVRVTETRRRVESPLRRQYPHAECSEQDLFDRDPRWHLRQGAEQDIRAFIAVCRGEVLERLGARFHSRTLLGCDLLVDATAYLVLAKQFDLLSRQSADDRNPFRVDYDRSVESIISTGAADEDNDGQIESWEGPRRAIRMGRAS